MSRVARVPLTVMLVGVFAAACQEGSVIEPAPVNLPVALAETPITPDGPLDSDTEPPILENEGFGFGTFWVCKSGDDAEFDVTVDGVTEPGIALSDGDCFLAASATGDETKQVSIAEVDNPNSDLVRVKVWFLIDPGPEDHFFEVGHDWPTDGPIPPAVAGPISQNNKLACLVIFYDVPVEETAEGRMTGGGVKAVGWFPVEDEVDLVQGPVTLGLTLHCDILLSNNLEVNWPGHKWHIKKESLTDVVCTKPGIPDPPVAPINTFHARAIGHYDNGEAESLIVFTFVDLGEPGRFDTIEMVIYPGTDDTADPVLIVNEQQLPIGNFQMHYDQPHGQNK